MTPVQVRAAYGINQIAGDGTGQTIAVIDAYDDPNIAGDLQVFCTTYGLPAANFTKLNQNGVAGSYPAGNTGWGLEEALDVEWAHAIAPGANIILVEANSDSYSDLMTAVNTARNYPGVSVVSMSWGGSEFSGETSYDSYFTTPSGHTGVTFLASTGDNGSPGGYPAYSPNVVAVGGTTLSINTSTYAYVSETGWSGSGGGISSYETQPVLPNRRGHPEHQPGGTIPDVAFDADPNSGVDVYDTYGYGGWLDRRRHQPRVPLLGRPDRHRRPTARFPGPDRPLDGPSQTLPLLYALPARRFPRRHQRQQRQATRRAGLRPGDGPRQSRGQPPRAGPRPRRHYLLGQHGHGSRLDLPGPVGLGPAYRQRRRSELGPYWDQRRRIQPLGAVSE